MKEEPIILNPPKKRRSKGMNKNFGLILFVIIFLGLIVAVPYYFLVPKKETYKLLKYDYTEVTSRDFTIQIPAQGSVAAGQKVSEIARASGEIVDIYVTTGALVKARDLLMEVESDKVQEDYEKAENQYQKKVTELATLKLEYEKMTKDLDQQIADGEGTIKKLEKEFPTWEKLYDLGEISLVQFEAEKKKIEDAKRALEGAKEAKQYQIRKHQINLEDIEVIIAESLKAMEKAKEMMNANLIHASISGKVIALPEKVGTTVQSGTVLAEIINESSFFIQGEVPLTTVASIQVGQPVTIQVGGESYTGKVHSISPVAKNNNVPIQVHFDTVPADLRADAAVTIDIQTGVLSDRLSLPRGRYLSSGQERFVFVIEGNKAVYREVVFGVINGNYIEVKTGLQKGDKVIVSSYDEFSHLQTIEINPEGGYKL